MLQRPCKLPIAPMGISHVLRLCLQGGGVFIDGGMVTFLSCTVTGNTAYNVLTLKLPIAPMGKWLTCLPRLLLAQLPTLRSTTQGVRAPESLKISHRPDGKMLTCLP